MCIRDSTHTHTHTPNWAWKNNQKMKIRRKGTDVMTLEVFDPASHLRYSDCEDVKKITGDNVLATLVSLEMDSFPLSRSAHRSPAVPLIVDRGPLKCPSVFKRSVCYQFPTAYSLFQVCLLYTSRCV